MSESDIYTNKQTLPPANETAGRSSRRRREKVKSFDETVNDDVRQTHRRRSRNSGLRRFIHLMRKPDFSRNFWAILLGTVGLILALLVLWDRFGPAPMP
jgi:hypothetical protein